MWDASSSSWTTTDVSTDPVVVTGSDVSVTCKSSHLGFFTVFDLSSTTSPTTSPTTSTTGQTSQTSTMAVPASDTSSTPANTSSPIPTAESTVAMTTNNNQQTTIQLSLNARYYKCIDAK
jgi:hypothetical protein